MKSKIENCPCAAPVIKPVKYPCLLENDDGQLAIAFSETERTWIVGCMCEDITHTNGGCGHWKGAGLKPCVGPRTITFEN